MPPRTILYTGKGGVGKTSVAAATALRCAAAGRGAARSSCRPIRRTRWPTRCRSSSGPTRDRSPRACGGRRSARRTSSSAIGRRCARGSAPCWSSAASTVSRRRSSRPPPGMNELFSLLQLKRHHDEGGFEVVVVDCAPTGETLRLLSFPDVAQWWLDKVFPQRSALMAAARPIARALLDVALPGDAGLDDVDGLVRNLIAMNAILRDHEHASIRLVMTPDRMVIDEARRTFTYLNLYGYLTDAVICNRVFPAEVGAYFGAWRERQEETVAEVHAAFAPVPVL